MPLSDTSCYNATDYTDLLCLLPLASLLFSPEMRGSPLTCAAPPSGGSPQSPRSNPGMRMRIQRQRGGGARVRSGPHRCARLCLCPHSTCGRGCRKADQCPSATWHGGRAAVYGGRTQPAPPARQDEDCGPLKRPKTTYILTDIHTYIQVSMHSFMHTCMHTYMHKYMHTYMHKYIHTYMHTYMHACIHTYILINIHTTYRNACMHTYVHSYIQTCVQTDIHTYIHPFIHSNIYI